MAVEHQLSYGFGRIVRLPYAEALRVTKDALKEQGFGILTEIDVQQIMREKRGIDFRPYTILGACNPPLAEQAFTADIDIGLLLPCNVVVYESAHGSVVEVMDPEAVLGLVTNPTLQRLSLEVKKRLENALTQIQQSEASRPAA